MEHADSTELSIELDSFVAEAVLFSFRQLLPQSGKIASRTLCFEHHLRKPIMERCSG